MKVVQQGGQSHKMKHAQSHKMKVVQQEGQSHKMKVVQQRPITQDEWWPCEIDADALKEMAPPLESG
jgi:hypothetical protein